MDQLNKLNTNMKSHTEEQKYSHLHIYQKFQKNICITEWEAIVVF